MKGANLSSLLIASALIACGGSSGSGTPKYMLSVTLVGTGSGRATSTPTGIDCGSTCSASLDAGSSVTLSAAPAAGSDFAGWSGSCSGTGACTLTMDAAKAVTARFTLSRVAFVSSRKPDGSDAPNANGTANVWRVNSDGTGLMALTTATAIGAGASGNGGRVTPEWSPDGTKIVFRSSRKLDGTDAPNANVTINIWRVNADGTGLIPLTNTTADSANSHSPQWSPDGSKVAFHSGRKIDGTDALNGAFNIWQVNADGTGLRIITNATAAGADSALAQWSPDGTRLVFQSARKLDGTDAMNLNRTYNIWRVNADGTGLMPLTSATALGADSAVPQWSPDGSKITFYSTRKIDGTNAPNLNGTSNIWRVNSDGTNLRIITNATANAANSYDPQWSPDGSKVAFYSMRKLDGTDAPNANNTFNVWVANADGTGVAPLTSATANGAGNYAPQWSRDGAKIFFYSTSKLDGTDAPNANTTSNIWRMSADGTGRTPLTMAISNGASSYW